MYLYVKDVESNKIVRVKINIAWHRHFMRSQQIRRMKKEEIDNLMKSNNTKGDK